MLSLGDVGHGTWDSSRASRAPARACSAPGAVQGTRLSSALQGRRVGTLFTDEAVGPWARAARSPAARGSWTPAPNPAGPTSKSPVTVTPRRLGGRRNRHVTSTAIPIFCRAAAVTAAKQRSPVPDLAARTAREPAHTLSLAWPRPRGPGPCPAGRRWAMQGHCRHPALSRSLRSRADGTTSQAAPKAV